MPDDNSVVIVNYNYRKTITDTITVTDSSQTALTHSVSDSITMTDSVTAVSSAVGQNEVSPYSPKLLTVTVFKPKLNSITVLRPALAKATVFRPRIIVR